MSVWGTAPLSRAALARVMQSLLTATLQHSRGERWTRRSGLEFAIVWDDNLEIAGSGADGLGCDSLEVLTLAAATNEMFHLYEAGQEASLLSASTFGGWLDSIEAAWQDGVTHITFASSGSTGIPKRCTHAWSHLQTEIDFLAGVFGRCARILSLVPAHHIYGFLFTAMLPDALGVDVVAGLTALPEGLARGLRAGDLVVAIPDLWMWLERTVTAWPAGVGGVVSTAPCPADLIERLEARGLSAMTEVYGSSETAGIALRAWPEERFRMMPHWRLLPGNETAVHASGLEAVLMDRLEVHEGGGFLLRGRQDDAVQVGGINVYPARVASLLRQRPGVAAAAVRAMPAEQGGRLKAFVVPHDGMDEERLRAELEQWIEENLTEVERPRALTLGRNMPVNAIGKVSDW